MIDRATNTWDINEGCEGLEEWELLHQRTVNLAKQFVHHPGGSVGEQIVNVTTGTTYRKQAFQDMHRRFSVLVPTETPTGQATMKKVSPADNFFQIDDTVEIAGYAFRPGCNDSLIDDEGELKLNIWKPPYFGVLPTEADIEEGGELFEDILAHLLRDKAENDWFFNWIARATKHPAERGAAAVVVTQTTGSGRGIGIKLLERFMGTRWTGAANIGDLIGTSAASSYSSNLINKTMVTVSEASVSNKDRSAKFTNMKALIAPYPEKVTFNPKGKQAYDDWAFYSVFIASNDALQALPIEESDRRFCILQGPSVKMADEHDKLALAAMAATDAFFPRDTADESARARAERLLAGAYQYLRGQTPCDKTFVTVLDTKARQTMLQGERGDIEEVLAEVLEPMTTAGVSGIMFNDLVVKVNARLGHKTNSRFPRKAMARALQREFQLNDGTMRFGFDGWAMKTGKQTVNPPPCGFGKTITGFTCYTDARGEERWQVEGLVVRSDDIETMTPDRRGEIMSEVLSGAVQMPSVGGGPGPSSLKIGQKLQVVK